ncbi:MAG: restriction endonuclease subunit S, partial [Blautia sp.]|nr:restriction endonuclease subunit S [Blautia sp.]
MREMKDSGVEWIGEIPSHWDVIKVKHVFSNHKDIVGDNVEKYERLALTLNGVIKRSKEDSEGLQPIDFKGYQILKKDDLVFKLIDLQNTQTSRVGYSPYEGLVSPAYICLSCNGANPKFAEKYFLSLWYRHIFNSLGDSGVRSSLNVTDLINIPIVLPNTEEQQYIASFLDTKCAEIDSISEDIRKEIETLQEYRKSIITEAVTKGLNDSVEQKETSIEGVNSIPFHWEESKLNYESYIRARLGWKGLKAEEYVDEGYAFISAFNIQNSKLVWEPINFITKERYDESPEIKIHIGDVLLVKDGAGVGKCARVDELTMGETAPNSSIGVITPYRRLEYRYLYYYLLTSTFNDFVLKLYNGMGVPHLTQEVLKTLRIPLPPFSEQCSISNYLDSKCAEIDSIIEDKQKQLDTLAEYRKSLIYEYVTGKKEVPTT